MKKFLIIVFLLIVIAAGAWGVLWYMQFNNLKATETSHVNPASAPSVTFNKLINSAIFACDENKSLTALFYDGPSTPSESPDKPPTPGGSVRLTSNDGLSAMLKQTLSADGARYANEDESFVFWTKGNGAMVLQNNQEKDYTHCIILPPSQNSPDLTMAYGNGAKGFSIRTPQEYTVLETYKYQALGPGKDIDGVSFILPTAVASGTNLSNDSYVSVEQLPNIQNCTANLFLTNQGISSTEVTEGDMTYSLASSTDAGAGNRYEEIVYALPGTNPCIGIRYFIHYGAIENYPQGAVKEFDKQALIKQFDEVRRTLILNQQPH